MKILCFDLDDTLCDLHTGELIARLKLRQELAHSSDMPEDMIGRAYDILGAQVKQHYMEMVSDGLGEMEIRAIHLGLVLDEIWGEDEADRLARLHWDTVLENFEIYPDSAKVIGELCKKYRLTMITNGPADLQWAKINLLPFKEVFEEIIVSADLGHHKPSKEIFNEMTRRTGVTPEEIVYIGNNYQKDIVGAHGAGWRTVWVNQLGEEQGSVEPTWTIKELSELIGIF